MSGSEVALLERSSEFALDIEVARLRAVVSFVDAQMRGPFYATEVYPTLWALVDAAKEATERTEAIEDALDLALLAQ